MRCAVYGLIGPTARGKCADGHGTHAHGVGAGAQPCRSGHVRGVLAAVVMLPEVAVAVAGGGRGGTDAATSTAAYPTGSDRGVTGASCPLPLVLPAWHGTSTAW